MGTKNYELAKKYIVLPLAIKNFERDKELFKHFTMGNLYLDVIDATIKDLKEDFYILKHTIKYKHGLHVRKVSALKYTVNGNVIKFTSKELKEMTSQLMSEYLQKVKFERKQRMWR